MLVTPGRLRSAKWRQVAIDLAKIRATRVERSVFSFQNCAFTIWLLARLVGEAGLEPALAVCL
jgi:hypothetical protein